jgi:hypothetical protein
MHCVVKPTCRIHSTDLPRSPAHLHLCTHAASVTIGAASGRSDCCGKWEAVLPSPPQLPSLWNPPRAEVTALVTGVCLVIAQHASLQSTIAAPHCRLLCSMQQQQHAAAACSSSSMLEVNSSPLRTTCVTLLVRRDASSGRPGCCFLFAMPVLSATPAVCMCMLWHHRLCVADALCCMGEQGGLIRCGVACYVLLAGAISAQL